MKSMVVLSLALASFAYADTLQVLRVPTPEPAHQPGTATPCAAISFARDGSIYGACRFTTGGSCGRYCLPAKTFYSATWDRNGLTPTLGPVCAYLSAGLVRRQRLVYVAPHSVADCTVNFEPNMETIVMDGYTFQYVTTRSDGAELLDLNNGASYLWTP
jgi:hypothetical protein